MSDAACHRSHLLTANFIQREAAVNVRLYEASLVSIDGFSVGPEQSLTNPLGKSGPELFQWLYPTRTFRAMLGQDGGTTGVDDHYGQRSMAGFGAFILGRNMFEPIRDAWPDEGWRGWSRAGPG